jgi:DNA (cytosine-5)-methyltransferase 1
MKVLDLFSGIGGFSLGLHRAGGFETVRFCEIDPFCQKVLAKHWPDIPCHDDITTMEFEEGEADVITAGFPCQDISYAGLGAGLAGERSGLFREVVRAIRMVRPKIAILENVAALLGRGMGEVLGDLAEIGYDAEWHCIPASAVGFPHLRDRIWIVAHPDSSGFQAPRLEFIAAGDNECPPARWWRSQAGMLRAANGIPNRVGRTRSLGNAVVPQIPEMIGRAILASRSAQ